MGINARGLKKAISLRGDCLYCPLPISIDSYWWCESDCPSCYLRNMNRIWGMEQRIANPDQIRKQLENSLKNPNPKSPLSCALKNKYTIRVGNKTDPFQPLEETTKTTTQIVQHLVELEWSFVIQTKYPARALKMCGDFLHRGKGILMPIISPGGKRDWEILEQRKTEPVTKRIQAIKKAIQAGIQVGVNGEPFIPGFHSVEEFRKMVQRLRAVGCISYNTYNFHFTPFVAKRLHSIGVDVEAIWLKNQDHEWRKILPQLLQIAREEKIILGCPDFVNTGWNWKETHNTCCGINVQNPCLFNTHIWKQKIQKGESPEKVLENTWTGVGDWEQGKEILMGKSDKFFSLQDVIKIKKKGGLLF